MPAVKHENWSYALFWFGFLRPNRTLLIVLLSLAEVIN